jgi:hypothetical protein
VDRKAKAERDADECNEVKGVGPESETKPREASILGESRSYQVGRRPSGRRVRDERRTYPRGLRLHREAQRLSSNQASDEQGLLGKRARQYPSMGFNVTREVQKAASRVMRTGTPQGLAMKGSNAPGAKVLTFG